jgi:rhodanese-related sulfurtransferase
MSTACLGRNKIEYRFEKIGALRLKICSLLALLLSGLVFSSLGFAEPLPESLPGVPILTAQAVNQLLSTSRLIDVRPMHDHLSARVPNSLHIDYREHSFRSVNFDSTADGVQYFLSRLHKLIPDRSTHIVLYCNGLLCWKSYKAAIAAKGDGYAQVSWFRGGIAEWTKEGYPVISDLEE